MTPTKAAPTPHNLYRLPLEDKAYPLTVKVHWRYKKMRQVAMRCSKGTVWGERGGKWQGDRGEVGGNFSPSSVETHQVTIRRSNETIEKEKEKENS